MENIPVWSSPQVGTHICGPWKIVRDRLPYPDDRFIYYNGVYQTWRATLSTAKKYTYEHGPLENPPDFGMR